MLACGVSSLAPGPGFAPVALLLDGGGGAADFSAAASGLDLQFQFRERPAVDGVFPNAMPAPGGHLVSAVGHNLHAAVALVMRPLGAKDGAAAPAAAGVAVSSALWRGEAPTVSLAGGSADLSVGAVVAGAAPSGDGAAGKVSWVSATALPAVAAATAEFPPAGPRGEPGLPEEGGAAVLLRGVGLASPGLVGAGCRFGSVGVAGRAPGGASAQGGLVCTSPALAPTRGGRRVPVALVWEFQGGPAQVGADARADASVVGPSGSTPAALSASSLHSIFGAEPGAGHPPHVPPPGRGGGQGDYVALRGGSALRGWGPDSGGWAAPGVPGVVSAGSAEVASAVQPATVWAGAAALVRVSGRGFREGASACEVGGRRLPSRFISSALLTCEWLPGSGQVAAESPGGPGWELQVNSPLARAGGAAREDGAGSAAGGTALSAWGGGASGGPSLLPELWPTQGPARGGTPVSLRWVGGAGAGGPAEPACRFGAVRVGSVRKDAGGFECVAPARAWGAAEVAVALGAQHSSTCSVQFRYRRPSAPPHHGGASSVVRT